MNTLDDVLSFTIRRFQDNRGYLSPIEAKVDVPFDIKRVFFVYGVKPGDVRGVHAHYVTEQVLICLTGRCDVVCKDGANTKSYVLDSPDQALYIPAMIWDEQTYEDEKTKLLVLANTKYNKSDYIFDFDEFVKARQ